MQGVAQASWEQLEMGSIFVAVGDIEGCVALYRSYRSWQLTCAPPRVVENSITLGLY